MVPGNGRSTGAVIGGGSGAGSGCWILCPYSATENIAAAEKAMIVYRKSLINRDLITEMTDFVTPVVLDDWCSAHLRVAKT